MARLPRARLFPVCLALFLCPAGALAQNLPVDRNDQTVQSVQGVEPGMEAPAHVAFVDGVATLEREGQPDAAPLNMPVLAGDRLRTANGRVEILFGDASVLHLDTDTVVDFQSDELVRLLAGRVRLEIPGPVRPVSYRIDGPWASAEITRSGEYRIGITAGDRGSEIELDVVRGAAELVNEQGRTALVAGERAFARAEAAPSYAYVYNSRGLGRLRSVVRGAPRRAARGLQPVPPRERAAVCGRIRSVRLVAVRIVVRLRLVSTRGHRLASVPTTAGGPLCGPTAGRGSAPIPGPGRHTTTGVGGFRPACGSGFPAAPGGPPGCRGPTHRAT